MVGPGGGADIGNTPHDSREGRTGTIPPVTERPATEGDRAWRERTQRTGRHAKELQPPHDPQNERGNPVPAAPKKRQRDGV